MTLDLGAPALEIAIALSFVFFLLSVIVSTVGEWFAGIAKLRSKTLRKGVEGMLGDQALVNGLFSHALVRTELNKDQPTAALPEETEKSLSVLQRWRLERGPSYISPRTFALAMQDLLKAGNGASGRSGAVVAQLRAITDAAPNSLAIPDVAALERWFDEAMERVGGWYKRKSQIIVIVIAAAITISLNASALRIVERLESEPVVRASMVAQAEAAASKEEFKPTAAPTSGESSGEAQLKQAGEDAEQAYAKLDALKLPLLWSHANDPFTSVRTFWTTLAGWLITLVAISLGAPFWFDALKKLSNLRMAGKKPEAKGAG